MTMSTRIPGSLAGMPMPDSKPAGRVQPTPDGFDTACRGAAATSCGTAHAAAGCAPGHAHDPSSKSAGRTHHPAGHGASARSGDGHAAEGGREVPPRDTRGAGTPRGPATASDGKDAGPVSDTAQDDGDDAGSRRHDRESDDRKSLALAITVQPQIDARQHTGRKADAATEAPARGRRTAATRAASAGTEGAARGAVATIVSAKIPAAPSNATSALAALQARLSHADAQERLSKHDGAASAPQTEKDGSSAKAGAAAAAQKPVTEAGTGGPFPVQGMSGSEKARQARANGMERLADAAAHGQERVHDKSSADGASGQQVGAAATGAGVASPAGPSPQAANVASLVDGIAARPDWSAALSAGARASPGSAGSAGGVRAMVVQLNPANLGSVTATLKVSGDRLVINLQVQTSEAFRQLSTGNDAILDKLKGHGYAVEAITVQHVDRPDTLQMRPAQHTPAFAGSQGNPGGSSPGGQHLAGQGQGHHPGQQPVAEEAGTRGADRPGADDRGVTRTDGVYI